MEGLSEEGDAFVQFLAKHLGEEVFTLIDVGCSGGIADAWRSFGPRLRAFAFDRDVRECTHLAESETAKSIVYIPAFVGLPPDHEFARLRGNRPYVTRDWNRFSVVRTRQIRQAQTGRASAEAEKYPGAGSVVELCDPETPLFLPRFFQEHGIQDVDFVKIDVDGGDFDILHSLEDELSAQNVLGVGMEVNYTGSHSAAEHTFHNTDRFLRSKGFDLFGLTTRSYSTKYLPGRYRLSDPSHTLYGRPVQGDALYVRDVCALDARPFADRLSAPKLEKLASIFALFGLPDCAAEVVLVHRNRLESVLDITHALDLLAFQAQGEGSRKFTYDEYMRLFEADSTLFYPDEVRAEGGHAELHEQSFVGRLAFDTHLKIVEQHLAMVKKRVADLERSTSWRLTAPLQMIGDSACRLMSSSNKHS